jgi:PST family polysaccharide transporter
MMLQILGVGPILGVFAIAAPWLIPAIFGEDWAPAVDLYPFLAAGALLLAIVNAHFAVLYVLGRQLAIARISVLRLVLLAAAAAVLVPVCGLIGYGVAALAPFLALAVSDRQVRRLVPFRYGIAGWWGMAFLPVLCAPFLPMAVGPVLLAIPLAVGFTPKARAQLAQYVALARSRPVRE